MLDTNKSFSKLVHKYQALIVCGKRSLSASLRHSLNTIGFANVTSCLSIEACIKEMGFRDDVIVFFDIQMAMDSGSSLAEIISQIKDADPNAMLLALVLDPENNPIQGNIMLHLFSLGILGVLVPSFNASSVEDALQKAVDGPGFKKDLIEGEDLYVKFATTILDSLDEFAKQYKNGADREQKKKLWQNFQDNVATGYFFVDNKKSLRNKIFATAMEKAAASKTRLSKQRQKLLKQRKEQAAKRR